MDRFVVRLKRNEGDPDRNQTVESSSGSVSDSTSGSGVGKLVSNKQSCFNDPDAGQALGKPTDISVDPCDPVNAIPRNRTECDIRVKLGPYQPNLVVFPRSRIGGKDRSFQSSWFHSYSWLEYSTAVDSAFCFYCRIFALNNASVRGHLDQAFITRGFKNWHRANECFRAHEKSEGHQQSLSSWSNYNKNKPIDVQLDESKKAFLSKQEQTRLQNRQIIERLINIILCLTKGGRPLRGHTENKEAYDRGLFLDVVDLISKYDPVLKEHLTNGPKNCTYLSAQIQNDLICSLKNVLVRKLKISLLGTNVCIIADETSDCGHHEQMSIVFRFFNVFKQSPVEHLVALRKLSAVDAQTIFNMLEQVVSEFGVDWQNVLSVCFDGASTMSGTLSGVQMKCKEKNSSIMYVHCYAHCLNLVLLDSCNSRPENRLVSDFFGTIQFLYSFIEGSSSRHAIFESVCQEIGLSLRTLKSLSTTRWACRAEAVSAVKRNYKAIVSALEEITQNSHQSDVRAKGNGLKQQVRSFEFVFCLTMLHPVLQMIVKVSKLLQSPDVNLLSAVSSVTSLRNAVQSMRTSSQFMELFNEAIKVCDSLEISIPPVKRRKVAKTLDKSASSHYFYETKEEEMRISCYYPLLDSVVCGIDDRYSQETIGVISAMGNLVDLNIKEEEIAVLARTFKLSGDELAAEIRLLKGKFSVPKGSSSVTLKEWFQWLEKEERKKIFTTFYSVLQRFSCIPVTSCTCERAFSKLTQVKTKLRATQKQDRLEALLLLFVEQEKVSSIDVNEVIDEFKNIVSFNRRLLL